MFEIQLPEVKHAKVLGTYNVSITFQTGKWHDDINDDDDDINNDDDAGHD